MYLSPALVRPPPWVSQCANGQNLSFLLPSASGSTLQPAFVFRLYDVVFSCRREEQLPVPRDPSARNIRFTHGLTFR